MFWNRKRKPAPVAGSKDVAADLWSRKAAEMIQDKDWSRNLWQSHPITQRHIQRAMTGDPEINWLTFARNRYCSEPFPKGVSLGSGNGAAERDAINLGICREILGLDLSPGAIEVAREQAAQQGLAGAIRYDVADLDNPDLPDNTFGVVIAGQSVHHVNNLEGLAEALHKSMTRDGILILNEYVGPSRYQWTDKTDKLMNELLHLLPADKRIMQNGQVKEAVVRPTPQQVIDVDPTESVRSGEIMPIFQQYFDIDYRADFGGTLLQFMLSEIIANFRENDPMDRALIDTLVYFEDTLIREGVIESDFVFAILKPR